MASFRDFLFVISSSILFLSLFISLSNGQNGPNVIEYLPGINNSLINFNQYSGYVVVNETHGRNMFYWFVESQNDPANDPVVLWLNGGPGCSSLGGFFTELGPFYPTSNSTLEINEYSWNRIANVIFLESPSGVGFSYSDTPSDYYTGDFQTANDSYTFLLKFFEMYPSFASNDFWVSGESYGGHYVPNLAARIVTGNSENPNQKINLQGFLVGNAWTYPALDNFGATFFWWSHALNSDETFLGLNSTCNFSKIGPLVEKEELVQSSLCNHYQIQASKEMGNVNIYDVYQKVCLISDAEPRHFLYNLATSESALKTVAEWHWSKPSPCAENYLQGYLNIPEVQKAIHANISYPWTQCSEILHYSRQDLLTPMIPVYEFLLQSGINILVYSGDVDAIVPVTGTRLWLKELNLSIKENWRPWYAPNKQVGGYVTVYDGLTFATVRDAGHMVPGTQPERALALFSRWISKQHI